jgi:hypothetical protein
MANRRKKPELGEMWAYKYTKEKETGSKDKNQKKEVSEEEHKQKLDVLKNIGLI